MARTKTGAVKKTSSKAAVEAQVEIKSENVKLPTEAKGPAEAKETPKERVFTEAEAQEMIAKAVADALAKMQAQQNPQVIQVSADTEKVQFLWQAEVSDENVYEVGPNGMYGRIVGKSGTFFVPKNDLSRVMDAMFRHLLKLRWIIVVDGLTTAERETYGVDYKEGELLDKLAFSRMVALGRDILDIYPKLCPGHREMVAKRYHEAYVSRDFNVTREIVVELNRMSKALGSKDGDFIDIIQDMNIEDME